MMKIKVCGITKPRQMLQLHDLGIDYAGMIFYKKSKRFIGEINEKKKEEFKKIDIKKIGVFVNNDYETVIKAIEDYNLHAVQLHGDETDEFCLELMDRVKVIKVFRIENEDSIDELTEPFQNVCHYFLFDTQTKEYGGSGKKFNWNILENAKIGKPFFLSGGISLDDIENIKTFKHPFLYAVDINSKFETEPGIKDLTMVERFASQLKHQYG